MDDCTGYIGLCHAGAYAGLHDAGIYAAVSYTHLVWRKQDLRTILWNSIIHISAHPAMVKALD